MSGQLPAVDPRRIPQELLGVGVSDFTDHRLPAQGFNILHHTAGGAHVVGYRFAAVILTGVAEEVQPKQCDDQIWGNETALFVDEHHPVSVSIETDPQVRFLRQGSLLYISQVGLDQGVGGMVGKATVGLIVHGDDFPLQLTNHIVDEHGGHAVGTVDHRLDLLDGFLVRLQMLQVGSPDVQGFYLPGN